MLSKFLDTAKAIMDIKKQQIGLPIAMKSAVVTPLVVGDDLALRTSLTNPQVYDRELIKLLHKHLVFNGLDKDEKPSYEDFITNISNIDKICLIWAIYKTTYESLGKRKLICPDESCKSEFEKEIFADEILHDDSLTPWDERDDTGVIIPFNMFSYPIAITYADKYEYTFETRIPSIKDNNRVLSMITKEILQTNLQQGGNLFALPEQMTLLTKSITIGPVGKPDEGVPTHNMQEIAIAFDTSIPRIVSTQYFKKYNEKFNKYQPRFYAEVKCPVCSTNFQREVSLEYEFFFRSVLDTGESVEVL